MRRAAERGCPIAIITSGETRADSDKRVGEQGAAVLRLKVSVTDALARAVNLAAERGWMGAAAAPQY